MAVIVGMVLALAVGLFALLSGFDRDKAFYPTVLIVVGSYYALFAAIGGSLPVLVMESVAIVAFVAAAVAGFRKSLWIVVVGLAAHGLFDGVHGGLIANPGVPAWWPQFCLAFDVMAAAWLGLILWKRA